MLYFSLDETKAYSGVYLVSVAKKRFDVAEKGKEGKPIDIDGKTEIEFKEAADNAKGFMDKKQFSITFGYHDRTVLFRADDFQEAIRLADALVAKMIKSRTLLASMERYAAWRSEASTMAQIDFLLRLGAVIGERDLLKVALTMNKGLLPHLSTNALMKFEKFPEPEDTDDGGDPLIFEVNSESDPRSDLELSDGLRDCNA
ncbi:hypothetical protein NCC49_003765 [Naganishia albida]|nr:hypothetical protein NCC49_003765 [Naganishia albida]